MNNSAPSANQQIARAAGTVAIAMVISKLAGLAAEILTAKAFGTGMQSEAFFASNRFAEIIFNLVAGGALASAFIPTFMGLLTKDDRQGAWKLASAIANLVVLVLTLVSVLSAIFAPQIVHYILAPGFSAASPEKEALAVALLRIQLPSAVIFGLSGLAMGILNAHQRFLFPALAPALYQFGWIFGILVLAPYIGVYGLGWGVVLGALLHLLIQVPWLRRLPHQSYSPGLGLDLPAVREVARLMGPRLFGVAIVQLNFLVNTYLSSMQPAGSVTAISLAFPLLIMPESAIAQSIAIAALPTFSAQVARGNLDEMRSSLASVLRSVLLLAIPATLGLILLRVPIVTLLYQHGEFTEASTQMVAWALLWYGIGLVGHSVVEIISRAFYALHDTKTPVLVGIGAMSLNLVFSILFSNMFAKIGWMPLGGLALAISLATFLEMIGLLILMSRKLKGLKGGSIWEAVGQSVLATVGMGAALMAWSVLTQNRNPALVVLGGVAIGGLVYLLIVWLLRVREVRQVWSVLKVRVFRSRI
jgi:putative peptidoglycan lipid II flippase